MGEILGSTVEDVDPVGQVEAGDGRAEPAGPADLAVEQPTLDLGPDRREDQARDPGPGSEVEEGSGLEGPGP